MIAVRTPDNVLYCGDAIFGEATFKKYPILFYTDIGDTLSSFKKLRSLIPSIDVSILYHGGIVSNLASLIDDHEKCILEVKDTVLSMLSERPLSVDEITAKIMQRNKIPDDIISYTLTKTPIQAYVAELERENTVEIRVTDGINRAHFINKASAHSAHSNPPVVM